MLHSVRTMSTSETAVDFSLLTFDIDDLSLCSIKCMGLCLKMLLYALDELFHVFSGMGTNDLDGQCIIVYEILCLASFHCTEHHGRPKTCHKMHSEAYPRVDLNDVDGLEHLALVVYDGIFLPGNPPVLMGHHDWQWIIAGTMLRLIYQGATVGVHCPSCTIASHIAEQAAKWQGTSWHTKRFKPQTMQSSSTPRTSTVRSVAISLDDSKEDNGEEEAFDQFHQRRVQQSGMQKEATAQPCQVMCASPSKSCHIDPMWQTMRWLLDCETSLEEEEISWWLLVSPLTNGSNATTKDLVKRLMAAWKWVGVVSESPICPPTPTVLNIRQFLDEDLTGHGWSQQEWLLAYANVLQHVGQATDGRTWRPNGKCFMP